MADALNILKRQLESEKVLRNLENYEWDYVLDPNTGYRIYQKQGLIRIPLINKRKELVDWVLADLKHMEKLKKHSFSLMIQDNKRYASSSTTKQSMDEIIIGKAPQGKYIDHINSNGLDNREDNLRIVKPKHNSHNRKKEKGKYSSDFSGVKKVRSGKWTASISCNAETYHIGTFISELEAAKARDMWSLKLYGEYAHLNKQNGEYLLTDQEIQNVLENGIPEKYAKQEKNERTLPKHIFLKRDLYMYKVIFRKHKFEKSHKKLEKAVEGLNVVLQNIELLIAEERREREENIERNENGVAVLYTHNKYGETTGEFLIDDKMWKHFCHIKWNRHGDYAQGTLKGKTYILHIVVYKKEYGEIPKGYSVDHIDPDHPEDTRLSNLRKATRSQQSYNKTRWRKGFKFRYRGVYCGNSNFYCNCTCNGDTTVGGPYEFEEEAAKRYNEIALEKYGEFAKLNEITTKETTIKNYFNKETITYDFIDMLDSCTHLKEVVKVRRDWKKELGINLEDIRPEKFVYYRKKLLELSKRDGTEMKDIPAEKREIVSTSRNSLVITVKSSFWATKKKDDEYRKEETYESVYQKDNNIAKEKMFLTDEEKKRDILKNTDFTKISDDFEISDRTIEGEKKPYMLPRSKIVELLRSDKREFYKFIKAQGMCFNMQYKIDPEDILKGNMQKVKIQFLQIYKPAP